MGNGIERKKRETVSQEDITYHFRHATLFCFYFYFFINLTIHCLKLIDLVVAALLGLYEIWETTFLSKRN